jgi:hypothetical protein
MATVYPVEKDAWAEIYEEMPIMAGHFNNLQDSIVALETKVGVNTSSVGPSLDYRVNNLMIASTYMYFYENTAPTGWTATLAAGDKILSTFKPNHTGFYSYPQTASGNWEILYDTGSGLASDWQRAQHNHQWMWYSGGLNYSYSSLGYQFRFGSYTVSGGGFIAGCGGDAHTHLCGLDLFTENQIHTHEWGSTWRPSAAIGIIAQYTG